MAQLQNQFKMTKEVGMLNLQLNPNIIDAKTFAPRIWDPSTTYFVGGVVFNSIAGGGTGDDKFYIAIQGSNNVQPPNATFWLEKTSSITNIVPGTPVEAVPNLSSSSILVQTLSVITNVPLGFVIRDVKNPINQGDFSSNSPNNDLRIAMINSVMTLKVDSVVGEIERGEEIFIASDKFNTDDPRVTNSSGALNGDIAIGRALQTKKTNELILVYLFSPVVIPA